MQNKLEFDFKTTQRIFNKITKVEKFQGKWEILEISGSSLLKELKQIATIQSIGSSTRIEGSELSDSEVKSLLSDLQINKLQTRDEQEVVGYWETLELVIENADTIQLTENYISQLHSLLLTYSSKDSRQKGVYKSSTNSVVATYPDGSQKNIFTPTKPHLVSTEMSSLITWTNTELEKQEINPLIIIATFVYEFLSIHPFHDGNGRLSRLLTTLLLVKQNYFYVQYVSFEHAIEEQKKEYYRVLMECQRNRDGNVEKIDQWIEFFLDRMIGLSVKLEQKLQNVSTSDLYLNDRQKSIAKDIQMLGTMKLGDVAKRFEDHSIHTIKKDLQLLVSEKVIFKGGTGRGTFYRASSPEK